MKFRIKLLEASGMSEYDKMAAFNAGTRRENVKACGDDKLIRYQAICKENSFGNALTQIEAEMRRRGILTTSSTSTSSSTTSSTVSKPLSTASSSIPSLKEILVTYDSLIDSVMAALRAAKDENKLKRIADAIAPEEDLLLLYFLIAWLSKYKTAAIIFKDAINTTYNVDIKTQLDNAIKDSNFIHQIEDVLTKHDLMLY